MVKTAYANTCPPIQRIPSFKDCSALLLPLTPPGHILKGPWTGMTLESPLSSQNLHRHQLVRPRE